MKKYMFGLGIAILIICIVYGLFEMGFMGFIIGLTTGIFFSGVFFGIAIILENQENIKYELNAINTRLNSLTNIQTTLCKRCGKEYSSEFTSCPYCGNRE